MWPRILPFAAYMAFIAVDPFVVSDSGESPLWLYPIKITLVLALLVFYAKEYEELWVKPVLDLRELVLTVSVGVIVYVLWVRMDFPWAMQGPLGEGYNPRRVEGALVFVYMGIRIIGASVIVPVMEELFWRSYIIRYIISPDFKSVALGTATALSCAVTVALFGVEHNLWLAGMMAGLAYNLLLYKTRRLWPCIIAHGITNLLLAFHVVLTQEWFWW